MPVGSLIMTATEVTAGSVELMSKKIMSPCRKVEAVRTLVTGAAFIRNPPTTDADAPNWSVTVTMYAPGVRFGTENSAEKAPAASVGPKRLSVAVLLTTVVPKVKVTLARRT